MRFKTFFDMLSSTMTSVFKALTLNTPIGRKLLLVLFAAFAILLVGCANTQKGGYSDYGRTGGEIGNYRYPEQVALLLPLSGHLASAGKSVQNGFMQAYYEANSNIKLRVYDTNTASIDNLYQQAVADGADFVVGPLAKNDVRNLEQHGRFTVATLALNYTPGFPQSNFIEFGLSPEDEAEQAAEKAFSDGNRNALVIAPNDSRGHITANAFIGRWLAFGGTITGSYYYSHGDNLTNGIANLLQVNHALEKKHAKNQFEGVDTSQLRRQDSDMIFLVALPQKAHQIMPLLRYYFAGDIPVYATSMVYSGTHASVADRDLNGLFFCDTPWTIRNGASKRSLPRLYAMGLDAFLLAISLDQINSNGSGLQGYTGRLYITEQNHVRRILPWAQFQNGKPHIISEG